MILALPPATATRDARLLLLARGLRAASDGFVSIILPAYLQGFDALQVGALATATLLGALKIAYDLTLLAQFRHVRPPEEQRR